MDRNKQAEVLRRLQSKPVLSQDARDILELLKLRFEGHRDELVKRESEQIRGRALEISEILKLVQINLDTPTTQD